MISKLKLSRYAGAALLAATMSVGSGNAATITVNGTGSATGTPLQAVLDVTFSGMLGSFYQFGVSVLNVDLGSTGSNTLTAFALAFDPTATYEDDDSDFSFVSPSSPGNQGQINAGVSGTYDFCMTSAGNCTGGNANSGLGEGETEDFTLTVSAASMPSFVGAAARWQQVGFGDEDSGSGEGVGVVPLPAAGWMLLGALGGLAAMRRKRTT